MIRFKIALAAAALLFAALGPAPLLAQDATEIQLSIKNGHFQPAEIKGPAGKAIVLRIKNFDAKPAEFESVTLRVEKVIPGHGEGIVRLRPLDRGRYNFFDDFNPQNKGALIVE